MLLKTSGGQTNSKSRVCQSLLQCPTNHSDILLLAGCCKAEPVQARHGQVLPWDGLAGEGRGPRLRSRRCRNRTGGQGRRQGHWTGCEGRCSGYQQGCEWGCPAGCRIHDPEAGGSFLLWMRAWCDRWWLHSTSQEFHVLHSQFPCRVLIVCLRSSLLAYFVIFLVAVIFPAQLPVGRFGGALKWTVPPVRPFVIYLWDFKAIYDFLKMIRLADEKQLRNLYNLMNVWNGFGTMQLQDMFWVLCRCCNVCAKMWWGRVGVFNDFERLLHSEIFELSVCHAWLFIDATAIPGMESNAFDRRLSLFVIVCVCVPIDAVVSVILTYMC